MAYPAAAVLASKTLVTGTCTRTWPASAVVTMLVIHIEAAPGESGVRNRYLQIRYERSLWDKKD